MNKALLRSKMVLFGDTYKELAQVLSLTVTTVSAKINQTHGADFTQREIQLIKQRYSLTNDEVNDIFFTAECPNKTLQPKEG